LPGCNEADLVQAALEPLALQGKSALGTMVVFICHPGLGPQGQVASILYATHICVVIITMMRGGQTSLSSNHNCLVWAEGHIDLNTAARSGNRMVVANAVLAAAAAGCINGCLS
jgi:hypothetical protein